MKVAVLGGAGLQGRAVLHDLSNSADVEKIICADAEFSGLTSFEKNIDLNKVSKKSIDATSKETLLSLFREDVDIIIDVLPKQFNGIAAEAAVEAGVSLVNCSYATELADDLDEKAKKAGVTILPEVGLDPGIDLVLCGYAVTQLDEVYDLYSYTGGIPEEKAAKQNPLKYKVTWNLYNTLLSYYRPATVMKDGEVITIPARDQNREQWKLNVDFPGFNDLEAFPNGDAVRFAKLLGIDKTVKNTERRSIRWGGHMEFWRNMADLGFFEDKPVPLVPGDIKPVEFLVSHLNPRMQYEANEKDLVLMKNIVRGKKAGKEIELIYSIFAERDLDTGLFAMNYTVGYTASIVAQMLAKKEITRPGLLNPTVDIPYEPFIEAIGKRGIKVQESKRVFD